MYPVQSTSSLDRMEAFLKDLVRYSDLILAEELFQRVFRLVTFHEWADGTIFYWRNGISDGLYKYRYYNKNVPESLWKFSCHEEWILYLYDYYATIETDDEYESTKALVRAKIDDVFLYMKLGRFLMPRNIE